jgi:hypothetical protein
LELFCLKCQSKAFKSQLIGRKFKKNSFIYRYKIKKDSDKLSAADFLEFNFRISTLFFCGEASCLALLKRIEQKNKF